MSPYPPAIREAIERGELILDEPHAHLADKPHAGLTPYDDNPLVSPYEDIDDLDAELEALFAEHPELAVQQRPNRATRRKGERNVTRFETMYRGRRSWAPTQVPSPIRIAAGRRRAKTARASRKLNR